MIEDRVAAQTDVVELQLLRGQRLLHGAVRPAGSRT
jgi:hypothetical protein